MRLLLKKSTYLFVFIIVLLSQLASLAYGETIPASEFFMKRHSGRAFDPTSAVNPEQLMSLVEAARWAPSSSNEQPWNFIFCDKFLSPEAYLKAYDSFKDWQKPWVEDAPLLVIIIASTMNQKGKANRWAEYDTGAAAISMALQASELGLMAHQIGGFDEDQIIENFQLPENHQPMAIMLIGYEIEEKEENKRERKRKPIQDNFFFGEWGQGI